MTGSVDDRRYHRIVERAWSRLRDRATVLSPREFEVVEGWRRRGIPARIVLEVRDRRARRGSGAGRSLAYLATAVEEAWSTVASGRATPAQPAPGHRAACDPLRAWAPALERWTDAPTLASVLRTLLAEAQEGTGPAELDARLDEALPRAAPGDIREAAEQAAAAALAGFRSRMPAEEFERTLARARADRMREALGLPRLVSR